MTPEGVEKTDSVKLSSNTNYSTIMLILIIVGGLLFYFQDSFFKPKVNPKSIAVLPFDNYSPKSEDEFLSDGFTEVIIANLAKVKDLMVISRTSVMRYKDTDMSLIEIAKELNVANILEGSIQRKGNKIRVVGQLIEASTNNHLWAETYDEDIDDIFAIQTSIAKEIAASLKTQITESEKSVIEDKLTDNIEVYELYLKVMELRSSTMTSLFSKREIRMNLLNKIIDLDPEFAEAYAMLSIENAEMVHFGNDKGQSRIDMAKENLDKAYKLKPYSPVVRFAHGYYYYGCFKDYYNALEHFKYALLKEPGKAEYNQYIGYVHRRLGNWDEMLHYFEKSLVLNPNDMSLRLNLIDTYIFLRQYNKVNFIDYDKRWYKISPDDPWLYSNRAVQTFTLEGKTDNARQIINEASKWIPDHDYYKYPIMWFDEYDQKYDNALQYTQNSKDTIEYHQDQIVTKSGELSRIYWLMNKKDQSKKEAQKALEQLHALPDLEGDPRYHVYLGRIYAILGNLEKAVLEAKMAKELYPNTKDAFASYDFDIQIAKIYAIIGKHKIALDIIERLLIGPSTSKWWTIKYNSILNKIFKEDPRFKRIIKKDEEKFRREITIDINSYLPN
jgi:TolB-like protein